MSTAGNPGLVFLDRAHAALILVEANQMTVEEAIMGLAPLFYELVHPMCDCTREIFERMERLYPSAASRPTYRRVA